MPQTRITVYLNDEKSDVDRMILEHLHYAQHEQIRCRDRTSLSGSVKEALAVQFGSLPPKSEIMVGAKNG